MNISGIRAGDIVEVDGPMAKGGEGAHSAARFHAFVVDNPGGELTCRRLAGGRSFAVRPRLVVDHWRKAGRPRSSGSSSTTTREASLV